VLWIGIQILAPLRYLAYPGNVSWTEEGHRFAWMMKLRDKDASARFMVRDPASGREWRVLPEDYLRRHQVGEMESRPDMILQFAHHLARVWAEERKIAGVGDLARIPRSLRHADWILPLTQPFERPEPRTGRVDLRC
jgi:vitamin K-dependent gamma-carboxylase